MTGLEKILDKINSESYLAAKAIVSEAEGKAVEIMKRADSDSARIAREIESLARVQCDRIIERAKSSAELSMAQNLLRKKREIIDEVIEAAKNKLVNLPDKEYFEFMSKLLRANTAKKSGEIVFNEIDKKRLPSDFDLKGHRVSEKTGDFKGGFILDYGDIEINCTVSALFEGAYDELSDTVNGILFRGV